MVLRGYALRHVFLASALRRAAALFESSNSMPEHVDLQSYLGIFTMNIETGHKDANNKRSSSKAKGCQRRGGIR